MGFFMTIGPMTEKEIDAVAALEKQCFSVPWTRADFELCVSSPLYHYLTVLKDAREVIAYGGFQQILDAADIENIAVAEAYRGQGIAKALLGKLLEDGKANGVRTFFLEVRSSNAPALRLYESFGFRQIGTRRDYYREPREDALVYSLKIGEDNTPEG